MWPLGWRCACVYSRAFSAIASGVVQLATAQDSSGTQSVLMRITDESEDEAEFTSRPAGGTYAEPAVLWIRDTGTAPILSDWLTTRGDVATAQFQPSILPESFSRLRVGRPSPTTPLSTSDVLASAGIGMRFSGSPVVTVSALEPLAQSTSTGIDSLLLAARATSGQQRQPTASEVVIAGRRKGQTPGGSHWIPTREDLDTMLSKIDSRLVSRVEVTEGPYNVMEGPGLAFLDVELLPAPRFADAYESHGQTIINYQTNGEQWHGRQSVEGGDQDWGYRIGYSHNTGSDYESGDGEQFPASYNSRMPDLAVGAELTDNSAIDLHYFRIDQTDVEFPGQVFDMDWLVTDAYQVKYTLQDQAWFDLLYVEGWYNRTRFEGNANSPRKRQQIPVLNDFLVSGETDADAMTAGGTAALTWDGVAKYLTVGADFRFAKQRLNEIDQLVSRNPFDPTPIGLIAPIPRSHSIDPGMFIEGQFAADEATRARAGGRVDWVSANADEFVTGVPGNLEDALGGSFDQHFTTWSTFLELERDLTESWSGIAAAGHSMRPPTMSELYAVNPFLAVMPQFLFNSPSGNPLLDPERLWQIDLGFNYESTDLRAGLRGFHGWVQDYITMDVSPGTLIDTNEVSFIYTWVNTKLATLAGGRAFFEYDSSRMVSWFGQLSYVEGRDHTRRPSNSPLRVGSSAPERSQTNFSAGTDEEPLPVMPPFGGQVGVRLHDVGEQPRWLVEFLVRMVDNQDRVATSLFEQPTPGFSTVDIRGYWYPRENWRLLAGVENLGDRNYQEHFDPHKQLGAEVFRLGRNFFVGSELTY